MIRDLRRGQGGSRRGLRVWEGLGIQGSKKGLGSGRELEGSGGGWVSEGVGGLGGELRVRERG